MKLTTGMLLLCLLAGAVSAQTNQTWQVCRYPLRVFPNNRVVNLTPLFQWWQQQSSPTNANHFKVANINFSTNSGEETTEDNRPLTAWHLVTGAPVATTGTSWVVNAVVYTSPSARTNTQVILRNPPTAEEQTYLLLQNQLAEANVEITNAERTYQADLKAALAAEDRAMAYARSHTKVASTGYAVYTTRARQYQQAADSATGQKRQLEALRRQFLDQLKTIPSVNGEYRVNWFAMQVGHTKVGLPVYDMGFPNSSLP